MQTTEIPAIIPNKNINDVYHKTNEPQCLDKAVMQMLKKYKFFAKISISTTAPGSSTSNRTDTVKQTVLIY